MECSHSSTPRAITPPPSTDEATSTHTAHGRPANYDSSIKDWFRDELEGASIPSRKGKGKMYQIISSSSDYNTLSPPNNDDSDSKVSPKDDEGASSTSSEDN